MFTIFPGIFEAPLRESLLGRAIGEGLVDIRVHDLREWSEDRHRMVDDTAYGGGPGLDYLFRRFKPRLERELGHELSEQIFVTNPARAFAFVLHA